MASSQTSLQQQEKSQGKVCTEMRLTRHTPVCDLIPASTLSMRLRNLAALRASILRLWARTKPSRKEQDLDEVIRFNETQSNGLQ